MSLGPLEKQLLVVVGSGGVGKTTLAAALALQSARQGTDTLVMTFDPSLRLKDALGVSDAARDHAVSVPAETPGRLDAALLDARRTFDRLIHLYAPDAAAADRIFTNRFYRELAGGMAGILEYMAMERLFEAKLEGKYGRIILDTPPTRQALDFLEAPDRIIHFLDSQPVRLAMKPWWEEKLSIRNFPQRLAGKAVEGIADHIIGRKFLVDLVEFIRAFAPLFEGFRERAQEVRALLRSEDTLFVMVTAPGEDRLPDTMFFLRRLKEAGHHLGPVLVNQVHPAPEGTKPSTPGMELMRYLGARDQRGVAQFRQRLAAGPRVVALPLSANPPTDLATLEALGALVLSGF